MRPAQGSLLLANTTTARLPRVPFLRIKEKILGTNYELSVAFISPKKMQGLNRRWRKQNKPTDILSFELSKNSGELYLCMQEVTKKSKLFGMSVPQYLGYLFIHGCLHLEGRDHGRTMDTLERKFCRAFGLPSAH